nr:AAA-like domain-containing protein [Halonatronum saccharophilum]
MKKFNITGTCIPKRHYMVDISNKLDQIEKLVEEGSYFTINRPRQYGKTTTIFMLEKRLSRSDYLPIFISFEGIGDLAFEEEGAFVKSFLRQIKKEVRLKEKWIVDFIKEYNTIESFDDLDEFIDDLVIKVDKKVVLMIDEVDKSSNNQLFLSFLGILRNKYLRANMGKDYTFHSIILAGVHDVKNLKVKLRPDEEQKYNSPWNIAVNFNVEMSFNPKEIETMLREYKDGKGIEIDIPQVAQRIYYYTSGYPYLVSKVAKVIDEDILTDKEKRNGN